MAKHHSKSVTDIPVTTFTHTWSIKNFSIIPADVNSVNCADFSPPLLKDKWYMKLKLKSLDEADAREYLDISLFLRSCENKNKDQVRAKFVISVLDSKGGRRFTCKSSQPEVRVFKAARNGHAFNLFAPRDVLFNADEQILGAEDTLQLLCEITVFGELTSRLLPKLDTVLYTEKEMAVGCLSDNVSALLRSQEAIDTIVETNDGVQLKVHKLILKMRSKVFEAMFEHNTAEKADKKILITDFESRVTKEMINFIYTDEVSDIGDIAGDLLMAADKYDLPKLKKICEEYLASNAIGPDTSVYLLTLSDCCNCPKLKDKVMEFITMNATEVCETAEWKKQAGKRPYLYKDAFEALLKKQRTN